MSIIYNPAIGLTNPLLSDLLANSHAFTGVDAIIMDAVAAANAGWTKKVYASARTDSRSGTGMWEDDSIDISTAVKLDNFLQVLLPAIGTGCHVIFGPGTFQTYGSGSSFGGISHGANLPAGNWYEGTGMFETIFQQTQIPDNGIYTTIGTLSQIDNSFTRISDMTVDSNWQNVSIGATNKVVGNGIELNGNYCEIIRVRGLNAYGSTTNGGAECFQFKIASSTIAGVVQSIFGCSIHHCEFDNFRGDYGGASVIWNLQASASFNPSYNAIYCNTYRNHNGRSIPNSGSGTQYCIGGFIGQGGLVYGNRAFNCMNLYYSEGNQGGTRIFGNVSLNTLGNPLSHNGQATSDLDLHIHNNWFEVAPEILGTGLNNNVRVGLNVTCGSGTPSGKHRIYDNTVVLRPSIYQVVSRSHSGTTATVNFSPAPGPANQGFNNNDTVDTSKFGDARYNVGFTQISRITASQYQYQTPNNSFTETGPVADITGTLTLCLGGLGITSNTNGVGYVECFDNRIDSGFYNQINPVGGACILTRWDNNLTETGGPITMLPGGNHQLPSEVRWPATSDPLTNGTNLSQAINHALTIYPGGSAPTATSRVSIMLPIGNYTVTAGSINAGTGDYIPVIGVPGIVGSCYFTANFVDLIGLGNRDNTIITSSGISIAHTDSNTTQTDVQMWNFTITTSLVSTVGPGADFAHAGAYYRKGLSNKTRYQNMRFSGAGVRNGVNGYYFGPGQYINCEFPVGGFPGGCSNSGLDSGSIVDNCSSLSANGTGTVSINSGAIIRNSSFTNGLQVLQNLGRIEHNYIVNATTNGNAVDESSNSTGGGVYDDNVMISNGTGKAIKNSSGARTPNAVINCRGNVTYDAGTITPTVAANNNFNAVITQ